MGKLQISLSQALVIVSGFAFVAFMVWDKLSTLDAAGAMVATVVGGLYLAMSNGGPPSPPSVASVSP